MFKNWPISHFNIMFFKCISWGYIKTTPPWIILGSIFTIFLVPSLIEEFLEHLYSIWDTDYVFNFLKVIHWHWNIKNFWCRGLCENHGISFSSVPCPHHGENHARIRMHPKLKCCLGRKQRKLAVLQKPVKGQGRFCRT